MPGRMPRACIMMAPVVTRRAASIRGRFALERQRV